MKGVGGSEVWVVGSIIGEAAEDVSVGEAAEDISVVGCEGEFGSCAE
ncbi:hypothetical protein A2U01_0038134, partial [Trifolium medium]|nr:hypothetical protein [Trifolium medium]